MCVVCVGGRPEAGWCVWVLFWWHLWCKAVIVVAFLWGFYSNAFPRKHRVEVDEAGGNVVGNFLFVAPDASDYSCN